VPPELTVKAFEREDIPRFFTADRARTSAFSRFLDQGFLGVLLHDGKQWVSYCWITTPQTGIPPHLSAVIHGLQPYWLFNAHVRDEFRRGGLHKLIVRLSLKRIYDLSGPSSVVFADTDVENIPARRSMRTLGFAPAGLLRLRRFSIPRVYSVARGEWHPDAPHPFLELTER